MTRSHQVGVNHVLCVCRFWGGYPDMSRTVSWSKGVFYCSCFLEDEPAAVATKAKVEQQPPSFSQLPFRAAPPKFWQCLWDDLADGHIRANLCIHEFLSFPSPPPWQLTVLRRKGSVLMVRTKLETRHEFAKFLRGDCSVTLCPSFGQQSLYDTAIFSQLNIVLEFRMTL